MARILVVEDDAEAAARLIRILEAHGHVVTSGSTTRDAMDLVDASSPDLVILDVMFPESPTGGLDLARRIRRHRPTRNLPVILLTSINQELSLGLTAGDIDAQWLPAQELLEKPVDEQKLVKTMQRLLKTPNA